MGVERKIIIRGTGSSPAPQDKVSVRYTGWLYDAKKSNKEFKGKQFNSNNAPGRAVLSFTIGTGMVITGWDEGIMQMKLGEKAMLTISPDYAYGDKAQPKIPAGSTLIFEVDLCKINDKSA